MDQMHKRGDRERGSNLVEMALVLFVLVFFLIGVGDIGRAFHSWITVTNAAREGARYGSRVPQVIGVDDRIKAAVVQEAANSGVTLDEASGLARITIAPSLALRSEGNPLTVTVQYTYTTILGGLVGLERLSLRSETHMALFAGYEP